MLGILAEITLLAYIARNSTAGLKFLLYILCGYWFISFFLRPLIFIYSRKLNINSAIYDSRIGQSESNFMNIMFSILLGCLVFSIPLLLQLKFSRNSHLAWKKFANPQEFSWLLIFGTSSGVLSAIIEQTSLKNAISKSLVSLVPFCFCAFLWTRKSLCLSKAKQIYLFSTSSISIVLLATTSGQFKGILLTPLLVYFSRLPIWEKNRSKLHRILLVFFGILLLIPLFTVLQTRKLGGASISQFNSYSESMPWFLSPFLAICVRFDQFPRVADAYFAGPGALGGWFDWLKRILVYLQWNPVSGRDSISFGQEWNQMVRNQSIPGARFSKVSLAQGMIGEGLIWAGTLSLIIECLVLSVVFIWVGRALEREGLSVIFAFAIVDNGTLFEAGTVKFSGSLSNSAKIVLFLWLSLSMRNASRNQSRSNVPSG